MCRLPVFLLGLNNFHRRGENPDEGASTNRAAFVEVSDMMTYIHRRTERGNVLAWPNCFLSKVDHSCGTPDAEAFTGL